MSDLDTSVRAWHRAGLISEQQVSAILAFEASDADGTNPMSGKERRGLASEALGYVGAALALGAIVLLFSELWQQLTDGARFTLAAVLAAVLVGAALAIRDVAREPVQRLASLLGAAGVAAAAWAAAIATGDLFDVRNASAGVLVAAVAVAVATPLHLLRPRPLPQLTLLVSVASLLGCLLSLPRLPVDGGWYGLAGIGLGAAWFALAAGGWLPPRRVGEAAGAAVALMACQSTFATLPSATLLFGTLAATALVALAVHREELHHLVVGALGLFFTMPRLVFEWFGDTIGAPALLLLVGMLLVLLSVGLGRARRHIDDGADLAEVRR
ncbi:DUF2157 domain-containing protein [Egicoccus sp. AB-alg6-2]|uniref:DUF2157 domain-containing protein n=1 Tax=Egicoccus sp. AB-alg6-2 TaxID=3242692 RepID=UPI00359E64F6